MPQMSENVTLVVYRWRDNEPGVLSWVCPNLSSAVRVARAMRNAAAWLIVRGDRRSGATSAPDLMRFRQEGFVLAERMA